MPEKTASVGVLISGRGSNLEALLRRQQAGYFARARIVCVASNVPGAPGLDIATGAGIPAVAVAPQDFPAKRAYEEALVRTLEGYGVEWVALAGYMKIVGKALLERFAGRILNIHPSLLPSFPGLHAQQQALDHGVKVSGCTVHFVDAGMDTGPIIGQRAVPVLDCDDDDSLSARILEQEHQLYAECLRRVTEERWEIRGRSVVFL
jgi:phosphoribosylglycinamide formyltransferase-1